MQFFFTVQTKDGSPKKEYKWQKLKEIQSREIDGESGKDEDLA